MRFTAKQYAQALLDTVEKTDPKDLDIVLNNFVTILFGNNDLRLFESIASEFYKLELERKGIKEVEVISGHTLNHENEKNILDRLNKEIKGKIELKKKIDENLVGGVLIRFEDKEIDTTVTNSLEQLKRNMTE